MDTGLAADEQVRGTAASAGGFDAYFEESYLRLRDPLFHYMRRFTDDLEEAADLTARTFERALSKSSSYRGGREEFAAWLFRIGRSQAIDATRRRRPQRPLELVRPEQHPHSNEGRPEDELLRTETTRELAEHVRRLPPLHQECLVLRYGSGLTAREIGTVIGKSEAATQKLISRALGRLRESYS
jgi:RNA polymerase sigma-70 factor, ECF subfamily